MKVVFVIGHTNCWLNFHILLPESIDNLDSAGMFLTPHILNFLPSCVDNV